MQTFNDCGPLSLLYTELAVLNESQLIGTFSFDQEEIRKLRLAQKEAILNNTVSWRIGFISRPIPEIQRSTSESSVSSEDSMMKNNFQPLRQSTPHRKRPAQRSQESFSKKLRKKLHLQKNVQP